MKEVTLHSKLLYDGKIIKVHKDCVRLQNGHEAIREIVHNDGGVSVLAITPDNKIVLIKQFRYPSKEILIELPGGKIDLNETMLEAGIRELKEETGYHSEENIYFGKIYPTVAYSDETIHLILSKNCIYKKQQLDEGEFLEVFLVTLDEALHLIETNDIKDAKTIIAILKYMQFNKKII